jgi:hypothetical protein
MLPFAMRNGVVVEINYTLRETGGPRAGLPSRQSDQCGSAGAIGVTMKAPDTGAGMGVATVFTGAKGVQVTHPTVHSKQCRSCEAGALP